MIHLSTTAAVVAAWACFLWGYVLGRAEGRRRR